VLYRATVRDVPARTGLKPRQNVLFAYYEGRSGGEAGRAECGGTDEIRCTSDRYCGNFDVNVNSINAHVQMCVCVFV